MFVKRLTANRRVMSSNLDSKMRANCFACAVHSVYISFFLSILFFFFLNKIPVSCPSNRSVTGLVTGTGVRDGVLFCSRLEKDEGSCDDSGMCQYFWLTTCKADFSGKE
ncbi:hypothetical protein AVEN_146057-1 [Araneus ventricosus]|uniref:Uncharacterized protein n=1 Tax=Araneus ventricosus TaxID=182803 RepID=A0A4Y2N7Z3_ARAVE|nr:hypothetical protein AVEN_146057-1 [Araneus ventricosus]